MDRVPVIRRAILAERSVATKCLWTAAAIVVPASIRWAVDGGLSGVPFVTFFPAVLLVAVIIGWRYAAVTALVSGILANRLFREEPLLFYVSGSDALIVALFALSCAIIIAAGHTLRRLVIDQEAARLREESLKRELIHRGKNMMMVVQSIAALTVRHTEPERFGEVFGGRIEALDKANTLLGANHDNQTDLLGVVEKAVEAFREGGNITLHGPDVDLENSAVVPLSLALHELCTNAAKYGALSADSGKVSIEWGPSGETDVILHWRETEGPKVTPPSRRGMGTLLLRPQRGLKDVKLHFHEDGVQCLLTIEVKGAIEGEGRN